MSRNSSSNNYHPNFKEYMDSIIKHPTYKNLPIRFKCDGSPVWVATKKAKKDTTGVKREEWADKKAVDLGFDTSNKKYADTMLAIHPTKKKVCQWCGETMDLHYVYPTKNTIKFFEKNFEYVYHKYDSIYDIVLNLPKHENNIKCYLINKADLADKYKSESISNVIHQVELACRMGGKNIFSPGAMSNFPDRFDGFHSYNLCCRKLKDKGRHNSNMATYNKDRRAYEFWSDGNISAANQLMRDNSIFNNGMSADHIGPISLGFIHDPLYLQPMISNDNSAKRDRLNPEDMNKLIKIEKESGVSPASFFSIEIWKFIKADYLTDKKYSLENYRDFLKQNMVNFMESLWILLDTVSKLEIEKFFSRIYFQPKYDTYFKYRYEFNSNGSIKERKIRNITDSSKEEFTRLTRVSFQSVDDFHVKSNENRKYKSSISEFQKNSLDSIQLNIINGIPDQEILKQWTLFIEEMQKNLIKNM